MSETTPAPKPNFLQKSVAAVRKHERKILVVASVTSTFAAIGMHAGIAKHNAFLKEKGLYEEFYQVAPTES